MNGELTFTKRRGAATEKILKGENRPAYAENNREMRAEELTPAVLLPAEIAQTISAERAEKGKGEQDENDKFPDQGDEKADAIGSDPLLWQPGIDRLRTEGKIGGQREDISQEPQHFGPGGMLRDRQRLGPCRRPPGDERKPKAKDEQLQKSIGKRKSWTPRQRDERCDVKRDCEKEPPVR